MMTSPFARGAFVFALALTLRGAQAYAQDTDVQAGKALYDGMCVACHGFNGAGQMAPPLNRPKLRLAPTDGELRAIISDGLPDRGMPRVRRTTDNEVRQLVAYVRSLGRTASAAPSGSPEAGRQLYGSLGCATCHVIGGQGGTLGPDLSDVGAMRGASYLRQAIVDPGAELPRGNLAVPARGYVEYLPVTVVTREGREVQGLRLNEDAFTIQLRDAKGGFHSLRKTDAELVRKEHGKSLMPSFKGQLSPPNLDNLVAYLVTLGGAQ